MKTVASGSASDRRKRPYRLGARAVSAAGTEERILDATVEIFWERPTDRIPLGEVARRADVTVQTVIRRFGGKEGLLEAAVRRESGKVRQHRDQAPEGDAKAAIRVLVEHYEVLGDQVLRMLAEEDRIPGVRVIADQGREVHRAWCARVFRSALAGLEGPDRERRLAQFVAVCDVQTWKLLRRDAGLGRAETERALEELVTPLLEGS